MRRGHWVLASRPVAVTRDQRGVSSHQAQAHDRATSESARRRETEASAVLGRGAHGATIRRDRAGVALMTPAMLPARARSPPGCPPSSREPCLRRRPSRRSRPPAPTAIGAIVRACESHEGERHADAQQRSRTPLQARHDDQPHEHGTSSVGQQHEGSHTEMAGADRVRSRTRSPS